MYVQRLTTGPVMWQLATYCKAMLTSKANGPIEQPIQGKRILISEEMK